MTGFDVGTGFCGELLIEFQQIIPEISRVSQSVQQSYIRYRMAIFRKCVKRFRYRLLALCCILCNRVWCKICNYVKNRITFLRMIFMYYKHYHFLLVTRLKQLIHQEIGIIHVCRTSDGIPALFHLPSSCKKRFIALHWVFTFMWQIKPNSQISLIYHCVFVINVIILSCSGQTNATVLHNYPLL